MKGLLFALVAVIGGLVSSTVFAGQINALGQWVPTSTVEGRSDWTAAGHAEERASGVEVSRSSSAAAGFVKPAREIQYRIDALGREVPAQTNLP